MAKGKAANARSASLSPVRPVSRPGSSKAIRRACDYCHTKRIRCSKEEQCAQCSKWGLKCIYSPKLKTGPKPKHTHADVLLKEDLMESSSSDGEEPRLEVASASDCASDSACSSPAKRTTKRVAALLKKKDRKVPWHKASLKQLVKMCPVQRFDGLYHLAASVAAGSLGIGLAMFKRLIKEHGIEHWPHRQVAAVNGDIEKWDEKLDSYRGDDHKVEANRARAHRKLKWLHNQRALIIRAATAGMKQSAFRGIMDARSEEIKHKSLMQIEDDEEFATQLEKQLDALAAMPRELQRIVEAEPSRHAISAPVSPTAGKERPRSSSLDALSAVCERALSISGRVDGRHATSLLSRHRHEAEEWSEDEDDSDCESEGDYERHETPPPAREASGQHVVDALALLRLAATSPAVAAVGRQPAFFNQPVPHHPYEPPCPPQPTAWDDHQEASQQYPMQRLPARTAQALSQYQQDQHRPSTAYDMPQYPSEYPAATPHTMPQYQVDHLESRHTMHQYPSDPSAATAHTMHPYSSDHSALRPRYPSERFAPPAHTMPQYQSEYPTSAAWQPYYGQPVPPGQQEVGGAWDGHNGHWEQYRHPECTARVHCCCHRAGEHQGHAPYSSHKVRTV